MKKLTHYLTEVGRGGIAACGKYKHETFGDSTTRNRQDVTCGNCKRTKVFREPDNQDSRNQQRCSRCNRVVGCDYHGRKHTCGCRKPKPEIDFDDGYNTSGGGPAPLD